MLSFAKFSWGQNDNGFIRQLDECAKVKFHFDSFGANGEDALKGILHSTSHNTVWNPIIDSQKRAQQPTKTNNHVHGTAESDEN